MKFACSFVLAIWAVLAITSAEAHKNTHSGHTHAGFKCPTEDGYFTHPNCLKFYQCGNWIAYEMPCAPGTHWNQTLLTCDHETTCQSEEPESPVEEPVPTTVEPTTVAPVEPTPAPEQPGQGFKCPTESGYFPHEDCWKFWQCGNNIAYEMTCAPGTQWEQSLLTCDHLTTCQRPAEPTQAPDEPETEAPEEPTQAPEQPPTSVPVEPTPAPEQPGNGFKCPTESGYFPHKDCWKFWQCGNNIAYEMTCAPGTQWEQSLLTCDHLTTCQRPAEPTQAPEEPETEAPEEPTDAPVEPTQAPQEPTTAAPEQPGQGFKCPTESGYFPHEDCWKFWQCGNNIAYEMTCAPGTQWEQSLLTCDHLTTCQRPAEPTAAPEEPETEAPEEPTQAPEQPPTSAPVEPTAAPEEPTTAAPEQPGQGFKCPTDSGYFPHEDCWKFWQCGNGIAYEMTCAPGTQWEQSLLTCDHLTTCQRPAEPTQAPEEPETEAPVEPTEAPVEPTEAPVEPPTSAPVEPTTAAPEQPGQGFKCPTESGYFPHEDCWKFWQCGNNIAYEMTCAPGTQWEQSLLTCDHLTTCQRPAEPTQAPEEPETVAPVEPTEAPVEPTEVPVEPTEAPVEPTEAPVEPTTAAPEQPGNGFKCPTESGYFPHEDCWKFWQCGNNIAYEMTCAPGTQWEQSLLTCDHLTTCQRPAEPTAAPEEPETEAPAEPTQAPVEPTEAPVEPTQAPEQPSTAAPEQPGNGFKCPTESGYFPHEDCWKFWQCGNNIAYEMTCAPGTQWEQSLLTCIHLDTCQRPPEPEEPTAAPEEPTSAPVEPTQAPQEPTQAPQEPTQAPQEPTQAPEQPGQGFKCPTESGYFPHEDCWKFWQCGNNIAYEMTCAPGTQWEQSLLTCIHLDTCQRPPEPVPDTTQAPVEPVPEEPIPEEPVQEPVETPAPPAPTTTAAPEEDATTFACPSRYGNYEHATCWKYWNCRNGVAYEMTCYPYTSYDQRIQNCRGGLTCKRY